MLYLSMRQQNKPTRLNVDQHLFQERKISTKLPRPTKGLSNCRLCLHTLNLFRPMAQTLWPQEKERRSCQQDQRPTQYHQANLRCQVSRRDRVNNPHHQAPIVHLPNLALRKFLIQFRANSKSKNHSHQIVRFSEETQNLLVWPITSPNRFGIC